MGKLTQKPWVAGDMFGPIILGRMLHLMNLPGGQRPAPSPLCERDFSCHMSSRDDDMGAGDREAGLRTVRPGRDKDGTGSWIRIPEALSPGASACSCSCRGAGGGACPQRSDSCVEVIPG